MFRVVLEGVYGSPTPTKRKYRQYSPTSLNIAYQSAIEGDLSVRKAAKVYRVPMQTLRDRVLGHVDPDTLRPGPGHFFWEFEAAKLVDHITEMAVVGYPYTRAEVINTATEFAICLGARIRDELMEGASFGADGTVSQSGWSTGEVFQKYTETHFIKYAGGKRPLVLLYDGHRCTYHPMVLTRQQMKILCCMYFHPTLPIYYRQWMSGVLVPFQKYIAMNAASFKEPWVGLYIGTASAQLPEMWKVFRTQKMLIHSLTRKDLSLIHHLSPSDVRLVKLLLAKSSLKLTLRPRLRIMYWLLLPKNQNLYSQNKSQRLSLRLRLRLSPCQCLSKMTRPNPQLLEHLGLVAP